MRLHVLSDLHLEHRLGQGWLPPVVDCDVVVVAGDVANPPAVSLRWLADAFQAPVVFVAGNHEFYGTVMPRVASPDPVPGVHHLENRSVVLGGTRFLGCTLWTDYELYGPASLEHAMNIAGLGLNDHRMIASSEPDENRRVLRFMPEHARLLHMASRIWLEEELAKPFDGPTVVVTHHAPTPRSIHPRFEGDVMNPAFASDLTDLIVRVGPDLWIHGHVHNSFDYRIGRTRVVANPKGYGDENPTFDPRLVIEPQYHPNWRARIQEAQENEGPKP
ncbi:metallophosphoesterase [Aureimonas sp. SK2]|uniref:metallophosphoesterase n=1 Tax=Aureimonas sp. SK2 TaxID=3015992 RepID=UPI002443D9B2|nr:metallophosphoesterase [Aureimonas sp. SK2]